MSNTQLSSPETYNVSKMIFSKPVKSTVKTAEGSDAVPIKFSRIMISTLNDDSTSGELVLPTTEVFSFGVSPNIAQDGSGKINGYSLPICLWNKDGALPIEKAFSTKLEEIVENCKKHLLLDSTKDDTEKYDLELSELKKLNSFIYWKREKGKIVENTGPTLYAKLIDSKKDDKIITPMFDLDSGEDIDPMSLIGKFCYVKAIIKIESIFVGAKIALQIKVYEAGIRIVQSGIKRLLPRPAADDYVGERQPYKTPRRDLLQATAMEFSDNQDQDQEQDQGQEPDKDIIHDDPVTVPSHQEPPARKPAKKAPQKIVK